MRRSLTYRVPAAIGTLQIGQRLQVPLGRRRVMGFFLGYEQHDSGMRIKDVLGVIDAVSLFHPDLCQFLLWMADYYFANPFDCFTAALPPSMKARRATVMWSRSTGQELPKVVERLIRPGKRLSKKTVEQLSSIDGSLLSNLIADGVVVEVWPSGDSPSSRRKIGYRAVEIESWGDHFAKRRSTLEPFDGVRSVAELGQRGFSSYAIRQLVDARLLDPVYAEKPMQILDFVRSREGVRDIQPTSEQQLAVDKIAPDLANGFAATLLHGITGSGKTLVYCKLIEKVLAAGKTALVMTPEIALVGTTLAYLRGFFGNDVAVIHSGMSMRERMASWDGIRKGKYRVVVGPRSAVFAPLVDIGLVIVDEEHDGSYKQDDPSPRFHGRDAAVMRAKICNASVVLGSASPSLESYQNAEKGRYRLVELSERPGAASLPSVRVVDMRSEKLGGDLGHLSFALKQGIDQRLEAGEQVILYHNRRGYSPHLKCDQCGSVPECPHCQVKLTFHKVGRKLVCHYCGYVQPCPSACPDCGNSRLMNMGAGTQRVEEDITRLFASVPTMRMDSDSATGRTRGHQILQEFAQGKASVLLGTQMVTKGLDLPMVTLVGVLSADLSMDLPDFRAEEKAFAKLLQVSGRSGRAEKAGEVLIQTYYPHSATIDNVARQDYKSFYEREIESRRDRNYPPFAHLVNFILSAKNEQALEKASLSLRDDLVAVTKKARLGVNVLGPAPCPLYYLRGMYRRHLFVVTRQIVRFVKLLTEWEESSSRFGLPSSLKVVVDVDADDMM